MLPERGAGELASTYRTLSPCCPVGYNSGIMDSEAPEREARAAALALVGVAASSLAPLGIAIGNGADSPFLFSSAMRCGTFLAYCAFLAAVFRHVLADKHVAVVVLRRVLAWTMAFMIVQQFD